MLVNIYYVTSNYLSLIEFEGIFKNIPKCIVIENYGDYDESGLTNIYAIDAKYDLQKELGDLYDKLNIYKECTIEIKELYYNENYKLSRNYNKNNENIKYIFFYINRE